MRGPNLFCMKYRLFSSPPILLDCTAACRWLILNGWHGNEIGDYLEHEQTPNRLDTGMHNFESSLMD